VGGVTQPTLPIPRPTVPGYVHGIVSLNPPTVQCDGCGHEHTERTLNLTILVSGIMFDPIKRDGLRLCRACRDGAT
jgi:hypothetical protein